MFLSDWYCPNTLTHTNTHSARCTGHAPLVFTFSQNYMKNMYFSSYVFSVWFPFSWAYRVKKTHKEETLSVLPWVHSVIKVMAIMCRLPVTQGAFWGNLLHLLSLLSTTVLHKKRPETFRSLSAVMYYQLLSFRVRSAFKKENSSNFQAISRY